MYFPGSPWPQGHKIKNRGLRLVIDEDRDLFFELYINSCDYIEEDGGDYKESEDYACDWDSKATWYNYHSCNISGDFYAELDPPYDLSTLNGKTYSIDKELPTEEEFDPDELCFSIYILGHDSIAAHKIAFKVEDIGELKFSINWKAKIALTYGGDYEYKYDFQTNLSDIRIDCIKVSEAFDLEKANEMVNQSFFPGLSFKHSVSEYGYHTFKKD